MKYLALFMMLFVLSACNGAKEGFKSLGTDDNAGHEVNLDPVTIESFTPVLSPSIMTNTNQVFFGITVPGNVGTLTYDFDLDGSTDLQSGPSPFYTLPGATLTTGLHEITVTASNGVTSASKVFQVKKNSPTQIVSFSPALSGVSITCGTGSAVFSAVMADADNDTYTIRWELDSAIVTPTTPFTNVLTTLPISQFTYSPDCAQSGTHTLTARVYDGHEVSTKTWTFGVNAAPVPPEAVQILSFTPVLNPVIITSAQSQTFAVTVNPVAGAVNYEFMLDNSAVLQTGSSSFYPLVGSSLTAGYHSLKVTASSNGTSSEKVFNLRKNTPPNLTSYTPGFTGTSFNCSGGSVTITTSFSDFDLDFIMARWKLDNANVDSTSPFVSVTTNGSSSQLVYTPDCTKVGFHSLKLYLSDGHEETITEWNVSITNPPTPPGNVNIVTFTPTSSPVVLTNSTSETFAVSIQDGAGIVDYEFKKDFSTILQNGTTPFIVINGASLTPGLHTLKVKGTNSVSYDEKVFNVRKNTPPAVVSYSPALAGASLNCGQDTITFNGIMNDIDNDAFTMSWELDSAVVGSSTPFTVVNSTSVSTQLAYTPDCTTSGYHTLSLKIFDGYETTSKTWTYNVINPTVERITSYFPTSPSLVALSSESDKPFTVAGTGIGSLTFKWKIDTILVKTDIGVATSTLNLDLTTLAIGNHSIELTLTDSVTTNDPTTPVKQNWILYRNEKPRFVTLSPSSAQKINISTLKSITSSIVDANDTFTVTMTKGNLDCNPLSECGLSSQVLPTSTGTYSSVFNPSSSFLGENLFTLKVTDSHGEYIENDFDLNVNYFSDACNNLSSGHICTLSGLPGLGSNLNTITQANKIRITPSWITQDDQGNWFFTDHSTHTVWYNNTLSNPVSILGITVPANTIYVVAGMGVPGAGGNGQFARKQALNFNPAGYGGGTAWDPGRKELYIADYNNNRVIKVGPDGRGYIVCGGANLTGQGVLAKDSRCTNPVDVDFDPVNRRLYISQYNDHVVKYVDASAVSYSTWPSYIIAGVYGGNASTAGSTNLSAFPSTTVAGTSRLNGPWGINLDTSDGILYVVEYSSCRIRAVGLPGATSRSFGSASIAAGSTAHVTTGGCASAAINTDTPMNSINFNRPYEIFPHKVSGALTGMFVSDFGANRVMYLNNSGTTLGIGNQTIANGMGNNILGNGTASPTNPPTGRTSAIVNPIGIFKSGTSLFAGIRGNSIIRSLDLTSTNGTVANFLGGTPRAGYSGNTPIDSKLVTFNQPLSLLYRETGNLIYIADAINYMIRAMNLTTGVVQDFIGTGTSGTETQLNTVTTSTRMTQPRSMAFIDDFFVYNDVSNNCFLRAFNSRVTDETVMGTLILQNRTNVIAGFPNTCGAFVGTNPLSVTNTNAKLDNPYGIAFDEVSRNAYIASSNSHCILKLSESGILSPFIGTCGMAGTSGSPVYGGAYNDPAMLIRFPTEIIMDPMPGNEGNFFFADHTDTTKAHIKYVNLVNNSVVSFPGDIIVAKNNVETVFAGSTSPGYIRSIAAYEEWFCYTSGGTTTGQGNNTITCRNRSTSVSKVFGMAGEGGISPEGSDEGALIDDVASTVSLAVPSGLTFNKSGDLIISEQNGHVIRMIKKWW